MKNSKIKLITITEEELELAKLGFVENVKFTIESLVNAIDVYCPEYIHGMEKERFIKTNKRAIDDVSFLFDAKELDDEKMYEICYDVFTNLAAYRRNDKNWSMFLNECLNECINKVNGDF